MGSESGNVGFANVLNILMIRSLSENALCVPYCDTFCFQKCIKRNLGLPKIREIENTDDWKCFKCNPKCIWDLRAVCWALLRYCDLRNK